MSQKNETTLLVLSLLITAALLGAGFLWFKNQIPPWPPKLSSPGATQPVQERISAGEKLLIPSQAAPEKRAAVEAIASGNYQAAVSNLEAILKSNRNDPEALIYLNNARIGNQKSYTIGESAVGMVLAVPWHILANPQAEFPKAAPSCTPLY